MGFLQDLRFGLRMILKNPGFTLVAIVTLGLGIGVNSTVFTIVNAVFLNGLPFPESRELMYFRTNQGVSLLDYLDYREQSRSFRGIGAFAPQNTDLSDQDAAAERVNGAVISANLFSTLGQRPLLGRDFTAGDEQLGAAPVALVSHFLWQSRYGGKPDIIGKAIRVNLKTYTVVGVLPEGEEFPQVTRLWFPLVKDETHKDRDQRNIDLIGRLGKGMTVEQAQAEMKTITARLAQAYPATDKNIDITVIPYTERNTSGPIRVVLFSMQGAVGFVLIIACANIANLLLSRSVRRTRETSIRTALGASRWRIVRQLLIESLMLSFLGGILGMGIAALGIRWFDAAVTDTGKPYWIVFKMDYHVVVFFMAICVVTGILFGLAPALQISKTNMNENLKEGGRSVSGSARARRMTGALLMAEIGLTIVLLVGAGLMIRSFLNTQRVNVGIDIANLMTVQVQPTAVRYPQPEDRLRFEERLMERLRAIPGIDKLTIASQPPAGGSQFRTLNIAGLNLGDVNNRLPGVGRVAVLPEYFDTFDIRMRRGRTFTTADGAPGGEVAIVNEAFVTRYFSGGEALGRRIRLGTDFTATTQDPKLPWLTIVGVSPSVMQVNGPNNDTRPQPVVYVPFRQEPTIAFTVLTRSRLPRETLTAALRDAVRKTDADIPLYNIRTLEDILDQRTWPFRVFGTLFAVFALIGLVLSVVGIYAVTSYGVGQRTQEIGLRIALGASQRDVMWLVLRQGLRRIGIGLCLGLLAAWGLSRVLGSILVGVPTDDPATFVSITILLASVTLIACLVPTRRAMYLDPVDALRTE